MSSQYYAFEDETVFWDDDPGIDQEEIDYDEAEEMEETRWALKDWYWK